MLNLLTLNSQLLNSNQKLNKLKMNQTIILDSRTSKQTKNNP